jgi:hypothetical protein
MMKCRGIFRVRRIIKVPAFLSPRPSRPSPHQSLCCEGCLSIESSPARPADALMSTAAVTTVPPASSSFDERWEAWQAKGAAHDRAVRRKLAIAAPFFAIVAGAIFYALVVR